MFQLKYSSIFRAYGPCSSEFVPRYKGVGGPLMYLWELYHYVKYRNKKSGGWIFEFDDDRLPSVVAFDFSNILIPYFFGEKVQFDRRIIITGAKELHDKLLINLDTRGYI